MNRRQLQFLESGSNIKAALSKSQGWTPNTRQAEDICSCLRQGRLFYDAANAAPLEIKPLQLYYGLTAFAKALVLGTKRGRYLSTLAQSHGVKDTSPDDAILENLQIKVEGRGTFFEFNNVAASLNRLVHIRPDTSTQIDIIPAANSQALEGLTFSLRELMSRTPELGQLYGLTFGEHPNTALINFMSATQPGEIYRSLIINDDTSFSSMEELRALINNLRNKFPFLRSWAIQSAQPLWGKSHITFINASHPEDDMAFGTFMSDLNYFRSAWIPPHDAYFTDISSHIDPPAGGHLNSASFFSISPIHGQVPSEFSIQFLAMHLLSSLVRYRPSIWMHAISRARTHERPADDRTLALIENLMDIVDYSFPNMVCNTLNPER